MRLKKSKAIVFLLAVAMLLANISALTFAAGTAPAAQKADSNRAAKPVASIKESKDKAADTWEVTLTTATKDADIFYTVDGKTPTEKSTKYDSKKPVEIKKTTTVRAIAVKKGLKDSEEAVFTYTIAKSKSGQGYTLVTPTPTPAAKAKAAAEPAKADEPAKTDEDNPTPTDSPTPTESPAPADDTMNIGVNYNGTITVGTTTVTDTDLTNVSGYNLQTDLSGEDIPFEIKSVTWGQSIPEPTPSVTPTPTPETPTSTIEAGKTYPVEITLSLKTGSVAPAKTPKVTFQGVELSTTDSASPYVFKGNITVPEMTIKPDPVPGNVSAGSIIKLTSTVNPSTVTGATISYSTDGTTYTPYTSDGVPVPKTGQSLKVDVKGKIASFEYQTSFNYTISEDNNKIGYVNITGLTYRSAGKKPIGKSNITLDSDGPVNLESIKWSTKEDGSSAVSSSANLKANTTYYGFLTVSAGSGYKFDSEIFEEKESDGVNIEGTSHDFEQIVYELTDDTLVIRVKNATSGSSSSSAKKAKTSNNKISGLSSSTYYAPGSKHNFTMTGATTSKADGNDRYVPYDYTFNGKTGTLQKSGLTAANYESSITRQINMPSSSGTYTLKIRFRRQVYNGSSGEWENTNTYDTKSQTIRVSSSSSSSSSYRSSSSSSSSSSSPSSTSSSSSSSTTSKSSGASTGDQTPIGMYVGILIVAIIAIGGVLIYRRKMNKK